MIFVLSFISETHNTAFEFTKVSTNILFAKNRHQLKNEFGRNITKRKIRRNIASPPMKPGYFFIESTNLIDCFWMSACFID